MWQKYKYYIIIAVIFITLGLVESIKPKKINWFESYSKYDKMPYGNFILFNELNDVFNDTIKSSSLSIEKTLNGDNSITNYIFVNNNFNISDEEVEVLMDYVSDGNNVFIAANEISDKLLDTLQLKIKQKFITKLADTTNLYIRHNHSNYTITFARRFFYNSFERLNDNYRELGLLGDSLVNFIQVPYYKGSFYIHLNPLIFTNIHMLKNNNHRYISTVLSHLPNQSVIWDEYYKNRKNAIIKSPLYIIYSTKGLREALYILLFSLLIYILFKLKRTQRIIPVLESNINTTVEFTRTIGQLYYNERNNKDIGIKRVDYFLTDIRNRYHITTTKLDSNFAAKLSKMSGVPRENIDKLIVNFNIIKGTPEITDERIIELDALIDKFYKNTI